MNMNCRFVHVVIASIGILCQFASPARADEPIAVGTRLELFTDEFLIESLTGGARQELHRPELKEISITCDLPWEGNDVNYVTVFQDDDIYRMYYRGNHFDYRDGGYDAPHRPVYCYAESDDGIHWHKPNLELFEFDGSKDNNIVWDGIGRQNFTPFKDLNPQAAVDAKYKAIASAQTDENNGIYVFKSADGIHWSLISDEPVITRGVFDSQNLAFWDPVREEYREYHRDFKGGRDIRTCTSKDFLTWTEPTYLNYTPSRVSELYTNGIIPYYRATHIFLGFPTRYIDRKWTPAAKALPRYDYRQLRASGEAREGTAITDGMFMSSRDAHTFRVWPESFIRPGLRHTDTWFYGDCYQNWGLVETASEIDDAPPRDFDLCHRMQFAGSHGVYPSADDSHRRFCFDRGSAFRRGTAHQADHVRGKQTVAQLFDQRRGEHSHRSARRSGQADRRLRAGRQPGALRRLAVATDAVEGGIRHRCTRRPTRAVADRVEGCRFVLVAVCGVIFFRERIWLTTALSRETHWFHRTLRLSCRRSAIPYLYCT